MLELVSAARILLGVPACTWLEVHLIAVVKSETRSTRRQVCVTVSISIAASVVIITRKQSIPNTVHETMSSLPRPAYDLIPADFLKQSSSKRKGEIIERRESSDSWWG